MIQEDDEE
jgi:glycyl-tRNA synthetase beta subunit